MRVLFAALCIIAVFVAVFSADLPAEERCPCPRILSPVCGSNHKTYSNPCLFECAKQARLARGEEEITIVKRSKCEDGPIYE